MDCRYAECRYTECRGANKLSWPRLKTDVVNLVLTSLILIHCKLERLSLTDIFGRIPYLLKSLEPTRAGPLMLLACPVNIRLEWKRQNTLAYNIVF